MKAVKKTDIRKRIKGLEKLIALGKEKGHLTFEEVNNLLPEEVTSSEDIDEIFAVLDKENRERAARNGPYIYANPGWRKQLEEIIHQIKIIKDLEL